MFPNYPYNTGRPSANGNGNGNGHPKSDGGKLSVNIIGAKGHGKTTAAAMLYLATNGVEGTNRLSGLNANMRQQIERVLTGESKETAADEVETFEFFAPAPNVTIVVRCFPGEVLWNTESVPDLIREYNSADGVTIVVANPFKLSSELAIRAWLGLQFKLQSDPLRFPFHPALAESAKMLFGANSEVFQEYLKGQRVINRIEHARLHWDPLEGTSPSAFAFSEIKTCANKRGVSGGQLKKAVARMCDTLVQCQLDLAVLREFVNSHPRTIVALSRVDLLDFLPNVSSGDLDEIFEVVYGPIDRLVSQQVKLENHRVVIEPFDQESDEPLVHCDGVFSNGGRQLLTALSRQLQRGPTAKKSLFSWLAGGTHATPPATPSSTSVS